MHPVPACLLTLDLIRVPRLPSAYISVITRSSDWLEELLITVAVRYWTSVRPSPRARMAVVSSWQLRPDHLAVTNCGGAVVWRRVLES